MHWQRVVKFLLVTFFLLLICSCNYLAIESPLVKSEAIVLLAGSMKERVPTAAKFYNEGYAPIVILANDGVFSEYSTTYNRNLFQVEWAEEELVELGVPRDRIVKLPYYGSATIFDVLAAKKFLVENKLKNIIVVTSDYHTRRSYWTFRHELQGYTTDISVFPAKSSGIGVKGLAEEYIKLVYYILKYGVLGLEPDLHEVPLKNR